MILGKQFVPNLISVQKIWDLAPHNALTDLIRFRDKWFCVLREADEHAKSDGRLRILSSEDGLAWSSASLVIERGVDLRDPKLSVTPTGQLMLLAGGTIRNPEKVYQYMQSRVAFSEQGIEWSPFQPILEPHEWLWRATWHLGKAYGVSYAFSDPKNFRKEWLVKLFESSDGINYNLITSWDIIGYPNEATVRFLQSGDMVALLRRDMKFDNAAWIGISSPPYSEWSWKAARQHFGGPNFIVLPNDTLWAGGRVLWNTPYGQFEQTALATMDLDNIYPQLILPSSGDCSYPGMVFHEGILWMSYYSSHESNTAVYLARIAI
jgi:hypothetical protein